MSTDTSIKFVEAGFDSESWKDYGVSCLTSAYPNFVLIPFAFLSPSTSRGHS